MEEEIGCNLNRRNFWKKSDSTDIQSSKRMRQLEGGGSPISKCQKVGGEEFKVLVIHIGYH